MSKDYILLFCIARCSTACHLSTVPSADAERHTETVRLIPSFSLGVNLSLRFEHVVNCLEVERLDSGELREKARLLDHAFHKVSLRCAQSRARRP